MSLYTVTHSATGIILRFKILNSSVSTGAGLTGLTSASSGLIVSTIADNESTATAYTVAGSNVETITTLGTYATPTSGKCRFKEVDATNHPGVYELHLANARFSVASAKNLLVSVSGATNAAQVDFSVDLTRFDLQTASQVVASVTGNVGGNVNGNVSGSVGSVTGAVGSVTGSVGSVTGNVGGSVASVTGAVGSVTGDVSGKVLGGGSGTISGDGVRASSVTGAVGSVTGAVGSVTGTVGGIAGTIQTFDAIWTKIKNWLSCLAGKTADTTTRAEINATTAGANYNETTDSQEAIRDRGDEAWTTGAGGGTVTVTPLSAGDVQRVVGTDIEAYIDETADITVSSLTDANGDPVDLSGETLKLCIEDLHGADVEIIANGDITVSGAGNDTITFTPAAATTAQARTLEWALRRTSDNYRFAGGKLNVIYAPNGEPS